MHGRVDRRDRRRRVLDLDDQGSVVLVVKVDLDRPLGMVNVHEEPMTTVEAAGHDETRNRGTQEPQAPRLVQGIGIQRCPTHVLEGDLEAGPEGEDPIEAFNIDADMS